MPHNSFKDVNSIVLFQPSVGQLEWRGWCPARCAGHHPRLKTRGEWGLRPQPGVLPLHPILTPSCWRLTLNRNFGAVKAREGKAVEGFTEGIVLIL
jgi:hypothetical protein